MHVVFSCCHGGSVVRSSFRKHVNMERLPRLLFQYALVHLSIASKQVHRTLAVGGGQGIDS
jgi:hypothetical protein